MMHHGSICDPVPYNLVNTNNLILRNPQMMSTLVYNPPYETGMDKMRAHPSPQGGYGLACGSPRATCAPRWSRVFLVKIPASFQMCALANPLRVAPVSGTPAPEYRHSSYQSYRDQKPKSAPGLQGRFSHCPSAGLAVRIRSTVAYSIRCQGVSKYVQNS